MDYAKESLRLHGEWKGKIEVVATVPANDKESLSLAYTPGVAQPCLEIQKDPEKSYELTRRHNLVAVITDGTAVLGLGDIGPEAGMPVMEGKCVLFKPLPTWTPSPCASRPRMWTSLSRPSTTSPVPSAASTWRTSPPPGALRSSAS